MANDPIKLITVPTLDEFKTKIEDEIPESIQYSTMPTASADLVGSIVQFTGTTTSSYQNGYFYKCQAGSTSGTYEWVAVSVQAGGGGSSVQSDWNQTDNTADDYIKNKPDLTEHLPIIPTPKTKTTASVSIDDNVGVAIDVAWTGLTNFEGAAVWTDGTNIYYSFGSSQYVLNKSTSTWAAKTWSGLTKFEGYNVWTDGTNIYYSFGSSQYVLNKSTSTWAAKTWTGLTSFEGTYIWTDGINIYYSPGSSQYVLNKSTSTWTAKTWTGLTSFEGTYIWTDGINIYYSSDSSQYYVLDQSTSTWTAKTLTGLTNFEGAAVWTDGTNIYYSRAGINKKIIIKRQISGFVDISGKADKVSGATNGNFAALDSNGNLTDSGKKATDFATASDMTAVQGVIPSTATTQNKLATAADTAGEEISSTATGTSITLTDSADGMVQGLTIYGQSEVVEGSIRSVGEGWGIVDLGTLNWETMSTSSGHKILRANFTGVNATDPIGNILAPIICAKYRTVSSAYLYDNTDKLLIAYHTGLKNIWVSDINYIDKDPTEFKSAMSGVLLCYQLADPTQGNTIAVKTDDGTGINGTMATFTTALPLRGVSDTVRDKLTYTAESKQVETVCGEVDLGTLKWIYQTDTHYFVSTSLVNIIKPANDNIPATILTTAPYTVVARTQLANKKICVNAIQYIVIMDSDYTGATDFKTAMTGVKLVYALATPTITPLTDAEISAFRGLKTYDSTTSITITDEPDFELDYLKNTENGKAVADIQTDLQGQIDNMSGGGGSDDSIQVDVLPTASESNLGKIYQYVGTTTPNRRNGFFYKCVPGDVAGTYEWANIDVQYGGIGGENHVYYDPIPEHTYLYGFDIHTLDSNPDTRVTYPLDVDNANYSPAYMDFANDVFNYGGWNLSPGQHFMPRPCMLKTSTRVAYYLNPNDYTKKADGTNSDVDNLSFDGNAMMEWNKIYTYRELDHNGTYRFRCSDVKLGPNWECWCNYDQQNHIIPHFYTRIYGGYIYSNKLRSISGMTLTGKKYLSSWIYYISNTGASYYMEVLADRLLINDLLVLMCKNTDIISKFGDGCTYLSHNTGTLNTKGMFWGTISEKQSGVKTFGMEDYWGNFYSMSPTLCSKTNGDSTDTLYYKITRGTKDGSTASDYNLTGEGYLPLYRFSDDVNGYISEMVVTPCGRIPRGAEGSSSEYECSRVYFLSSRDCVGFGGVDSNANPFYISSFRSSDINSADYYIASLSCKPLLT